MRLRATLCERGRHSRTTVRTRVIGNGCNAPGGARSPGTSLCSDTAEIALPELREERLEPLRSGAHATFGLLGEIPLLGQKRRRRKTLRPCVDPHCATRARGPATQCLLWAPCTTPSRQSRTRALLVASFVLCIRYTRTRPTHPYHLPTFRPVGVALGLLAGQMS